MTWLQNNITLAKALLANRQIIKAGPAINWFLTKYMGKFRLVMVDGQLFIHSHLPAVNSKAFTRFINEHLLAGVPGPSHAQISLTNTCPQNCQYCYSKKRSGQLLSTAEIKATIAQLKGMGVFWLGFTGGEPLQNQDIAEIVASVGDDCATKLFTTGEGLTPELAAKLKRAGLLSVSISLDHRDEAIHDAVRGYPGAFETAIKAIETCKNAGFHVSVSSVIAKEMFQGRQINEFIEFLIGLGLHEVWLSEAKPTLEEFWNETSIITKEERLYLIHLQDRYNKAGKITVNYLGHFEGEECFGCNAGNKMVYIDSFGEVSPCVFTPMTFGNVRDTSVEAVFAEMKTYFPSESNCFINCNYPLFKKYYQGQYPLCKEDTLRLMQEVQFSPLAKFPRLLKRR